MYLKRLIAASVLFADAIQALNSGELADLEAAILADFGMQNSSYGVPCEPCAQGDAVGGLVRLAFHDAAGSGGRSNGCIDLTAPENGGLAPIVAQLQQAWEPFARIVSFADAIVIASNLAIRVASTPSFDDIGSFNNGGGVGPPEDNGGALILPFRSGRPDEDTCSDSGLFPGTSFSWESSQQLFGQRFGLTATDIIALFGAHSIGRAEAANSGIEGGWTSFQSSFSTNYYKELLFGPWNRRTVSTWRGGNNHMQLTSDVEAVISPSGGCQSFNVRAGRVGGGGCPTNNAIIETVQQFANPGGTAAYYAAFSTAWAKMVEAGHYNLVDVDGSPTPLPSTLAPETSTSPTLTPTLASTTSVAPTPTPSTYVYPTTEPPSYVPPTTLPSTHLQPTTEPSTHVLPSTRLPSYETTPSTEAPTDVPLIAEAPTSAPTQSPVSPSSAPSVSPSSPECSLHEDGKYLQAVNLCTAYVHCDGQIVVTSPTNCSSGTLFNNARQYCDWPEHVACAAPLTSEPVPPAPTSTWPLVSAASQCSLHEVGKYLQATNLCAAYVRCDGHIVVKEPVSCRSGTLFNNARQYCDWPDDVVCDEQPMQHDDNETDFKHSIPKSSKDFSDGSTGSKDGAKGAKNYRGGHRGHKNGRRARTDPIG